MAHGAQQQQQRAAPRADAAVAALGYELRALDIVGRVHAPVERHLQHARAALVQSYAQTVRERARGTYRVEAHTAGDEVVRRLNEQLDAFGLIRHEYQRRFHEQFVHSCLPKIYGDEWDTNAERVLRRYGLATLHQETLIVCPRRFGKTTAVAMFAAAFLWCVPACEIAIFSTGKRTAGKLMALTLSFLHMIEGFRARVATKNQELIVLAFGPGDERKLNCYPGTVDVRPPHHPAFPLPFCLLRRCSLPPPSARVLAAARGTHTRRCGVHVPPAAGGQARSAPPTTPSPSAPTPPVLRAAPPRLPRNMDGSG